jgi:hypothetical protein
MCWVRLLALVVLATALMSGSFTCRTDNTDHHHEARASNVRHS